MSKYRSGANVERRIKKALEPKCLVVRSAGSRGAADLAVFCPPDLTALLQLKKTKSGYFSPGELEEAKYKYPDFALENGWCYLFHVYKEGRPLVIDAHDLLAGDVTRLSFDRRSILSFLKERSN